MQDKSLYFGLPCRKEEMKMIKEIIIGEKNYPKQLLTIADPPKKLYVLGDETLLKDFGIGIVGTRIPSKYGREVTKSLAFGLARKGVVIISGMAKGIDSEAHRGALLARGKTIAVLGSGFRKYLSKRK